MATKHEQINRYIEEAMFASVGAVFISRGSVIGGTIIIVLAIISVVLNFLTRKY